MESLDIITDPDADGIILDPDADGIIFNSNPPARSFSLCSSRAFLIESSISS